MAEVLGAVAAAAQLTATCLALIDLTKRIKSRSSTLKSYRDQLLQLHALSDSIACNPLLQTPEVELHTRNIISLLSHQTLEASLRKGLVLQTLLFFTQERIISRLFIDLERHKTTLSLVINDIQSRTLHQIQDSLSNMPGKYSDSVYSSETLKLTSNQNVQVVIRAILAALALCLIAHCPGQPNRMRPHRRPQTVQLDECQQQVRLLMGTRWRSNPGSPGRRRCIGLERRVPLLDSHQDPISYLKSQWLLSGFYEPNLGI